jgi:hypothetical protein
MFTSVARQQPVRQEVLTFLNLSFSNFFRYLSDINYFISLNYRVFLFIVFPNMTVLMHTKPDPPSHPLTRVKNTCTTQLAPPNKINSTVNRHRQLVRWLMDYQPCVERRREEKRRAACRCAQNSRLFVMS